MRNASLAAAIAMALPLPAAWAQETPSPTLGEIIVTAQRHNENIQNVPLSVSALEGDRLAAMFEGGGDIQVLAARVPSLYAESSNGRLAPRFYIRGLGNSDFDLAASQPVSIIVDEVVLENVILKSFPLFDIARVEVLRGPQGTLFGRNTPAGIVKFDTVKPSQELDGHLDLSFGELDSTTLEGAVGGGLTDSLSARVSFLYHGRGDWIDNTFTGENDAMGGYDEFAYRAQLLIEPSDNFSALFNIHGRAIDGTASIFRANVLGPGSDGFNSNYDRDSVSYDEGNDNPQHADGIGGSLKLDFKFGDDMTLTSITAYENTDSSSEGDIDGGFGADFLSFLPPPYVGPCPPGSAVGDPCIPFPSHSIDGIDNLDQITQEIRIASQASDRLFWQAGAFYFDSNFSVTTTTFIPNFLTADPADLFAPTTVEHDNTAWAVFGHVSYQVTDALTLTGGARFTDDEKKLAAFHAPVFPIAPQKVSDEQVSWDLSALYEVSNQFNVYGRLASGFRAPTIQGRDVAFFASPSIADSETITSIEAGFKSQLANDRVRVNGAIFYYEIEDQQLSAIGGTGNLVQLVNADKGTGIGFDFDGEFLITDRFMMTLGLSYTDTEIKDNSLAVAPCGSDLCTVLDPLDTDGNAIVNGNSFTQAPEYIATISARYGIPVGNNGEWFFYTDWAFQGETHFFIYDAVEFTSEDTFEGGVRIGYSHDGGKWEVALFGRNITDEENVKGAIDFNNLTGFDNEPRIIGASFRKRF